MDHIVVRCECGETLRVKMQHAGRGGQCRGCRRDILIPSSDVIERNLGREIAMADLSTLSDSSTVDDSGEKPDAAPARPAWMSSKSADPVPDKTSKQSRQRASESGREFDQLEQAQGEHSEVQEPLRQPRRERASHPAIDGYRISKELGRGGMGVVYKAFHEKLKRDVALKMIKTGAGKQVNERQLGRFQSEAEAVARMRHPGIVQVFDIETSQEATYFSMEYVDGGCLEDRIADESLPVMESAQIVMRLAEAMNYSHQQGVIHRDLKPANVLLTDEGMPKITDFGLAKQAFETESEQGDAGTSESGLSRNHTRVGRILGTPQYMAPEQAAGQASQAGTAADIYALGAILYCLLCGRPPFDADTLAETLRQVQQDEPTPLTDLESVPPDLNAICLKCLQKAPEDRYVTAQALAEDLQHFLNGEPVAARPVGPAERLVKWARRRPAVAGLLTAVVVAVVAGSAIAKYFALETEYQRGLTAETKKREKKANDLARIKGLEATQKGALAEEFKEKATSEGLRADTQTQEALTQTAIAEEKTELAEQETERADLASYVDHLNLAQRDWKNAEISTLLKRLEQTKPKNSEEEDLRGFEWHYWNRKCRADNFTIEGASLAAFSPDGLQIAAPSQFSSVGVWDNATGKRIITLTPDRQPNAVRHVAFSSKSNRLISTGWGRFDVWDLETEKNLFNVSGLDGYLRGSSISDDGRRVVAGIPNANEVPNKNTVKVWDIDAGEESFTVEDHPGPVLNVKFSPDGHRLVICDESGVIKLLDANSGTELFALNGHSQLVKQVAFSSDGKLLASGGQDVFVKIWDTETGRDLLTLEGPTERVSRFAFNSAGSQLATVNSDHTLNLWDTATGQRNATLRGHDQPVAGLAFSPDDGELATCSFDRTVRIWDTKTAKELATLNGHTRAVTRLAYSPTGKQLASSGSEVKVWDRTTMMTGFETGGLDGITSVAFSPDGQRLAFASYDNTLTVRDANTDQEIFTLKEGTGSLVFNSTSGKPYKAGTTLGNLVLKPRGVSSVAFSPDGKRLAAVTQIIDSEAAYHIMMVTVRDASTGTELLRIGHVGDSVVFSPDGKHLASGTRVYDSKTGEVLLSLKGHSGGIFSVAFSPDGTRVATGCYDKVVRIFSTVTGKELLTFKGHRVAIKCIAFSPDGQRIASAGGSDIGSERIWSSIVRVWDASSGEEKLQLKGHSNWVLGVAFSPDGKRLATASFDETVKVWDATVGRELLSLEGLTDQVHSVTFSSDGHRLAASSGRYRRYEEIGPAIPSAGALKVWDATPLPTQSD